MIRGPRAGPAARLLVTHVSHSYLVPEQRPGYVKDYRPACVVMWFCLGTFRSQ